MTMNQHTYEKVTFLMNFSKDRLDCLSQNFGPIHLLMFNSGKFPIMEIDSKLKIEIYQNIYRPGNPNPDFHSKYAFIKKSTIFTQ